MEHKNNVWTSLINDPPKYDCDICVKIGVCCEVFRFTIVGNSWELSREGLKSYGPDKIPQEAEYAIL